MEKRKRRPGGGRKPGEFGKLGAVMSLRLPEDLRDQLKRAGKRSGRSMSAELIFRARATFERDHQLSDRFVRAVWKALEGDSEPKRRK